MIAFTASGRGVALVTAQVEAEALTRAETRAEARAVVADLARVAVDEAVAVSVHAGEIVSAVRRVVEEGCPWRADAFGLMLHALDHADVWHQLKTTTSGYRGEYDEAISWEDAVFRALAGFDLLVRNVIVDPDPETRAMACLLLGWISTVPEADLELLRMLRTAEPDEGVRACVGEAVLRLGGTTAEAFELLGDPSPVVRHRISRFLVPSRHSPDPLGVDPAVAARARAMHGEDPAEWSWPAEEF